MSRFSYGGAEFPLSTDMQNSLLRDADPAVYYGLEFFTQVINEHIGPRLVAEAVAAGATDITTAVAESVPIDPEQYITEEHFRFPLLALHRESGAFKYLTTRRVGAHKLKLAYVLPPLTAAQAERLTPVLHAVASLIDRKAVEGCDPSYTPSAPDGVPGELIWTRQRAGVAKAAIRDSSTGAFHISNELFFPAIVMSLEMWELTGDWDGTPFEGVDLEVEP